MINEAAKLNQVIKDSEEYRRYMQTKEKVMENPELYQAMNILRRRNYELHNYDDGVNRYQEIYNMTQEFDKVLRNPMVDEFLKAEYVLIRQMKKMYEAIADGLEFDYGYLE